MTALVDHVFAAATAPSIALAALTTVAAAVAIDIVSAAMSAAMSTAACAAVGATIALAAVNAAPYAAPVVFAVAAFGPFNLAESTIRLLGPGAAPVVLSGIVFGLVSLVELAVRLVAPHWGAAGLTSRAVLASAAVGSAVKASQLLRRAAKKLDDRAHFAINNARYSLIYGAASLATQIVLGEPPVVSGSRAALVGAVGASFAATSFGGAALFYFGNAGGGNWKRRPLYKAVAWNRVDYLYWLGPRSPIALWRASSDETAFAISRARPAALKWLCAELGRPLNDEEISFAVNEHVAAGRLASVNRFRKMAVDLNRHLHIGTVDALLRNQKFATLDWLSALGCKFALHNMPLLHEWAAAPDGAVVAWMLSRGLSLAAAEMAWAGSDVPATLPGTQPQVARAQCAERERRARFVGAFRQIVLPRVLALVAAGRRRRLQLPQELWQMVADHWAAQATAGARLSAGTLAAATAPYRN